MHRRHSLQRVAYAAAILVLLALNLACPGPPGPPAVATCEGAPAEAAIEGVHAFAGFSRGGQGAWMVTVDVEWLGDAAPACALADVTLFDGTGAMLDDTTMSLETEPSDDGRRSVTPIYLVLDGPPSCEMTVEVRSYGQTEVAALADADYCYDAGTASDAGSTDGGSDGG